MFQFAVVGDADVLLVAHLFFLGLDDEIGAIAREIDPRALEDKVFGEDAIVVTARVATGVAARTALVLFVQSLTAL